MSKLLSDRAQMLRTMLDDARAQQRMIRAQIARLNTLLALEEGRGIEHEDESKQDCDGKTEGSRSGGIPTTEPSDTRREPA